MLTVAGDARAELWRLLIQRIEQYTASVDTLPVSPPLDPAAIRNYLRQFDFESSVPPSEALNIAADGLTRWQVQTSHGRYFGLFNAKPTTMGIAADALVAAFNPQIAAWTHNPFAAEVEQHLIGALGRKLGFENADGTFCSGGMEANHTAVLTAIVQHFPSYLEHGARTLVRQPALYASAESHHSVLKAARLCGLGSHAVRLIAVDDRLRMRPDLLAATIEQDLQEGWEPFCITATAGTTNAGAIDPLPEIAAVARKFGLWFHVDAAWGGAAALVPEMRPLITGIEQADSVTFDAHKWLSVPMAAGLYFTPHADILDRTFRISTAYMPKEGSGLDIVDPHLHSMQWSRRFIGLKLFLSMLVAGWEGYANAIRHQAAMGRLLTDRLEAAGWEIAARSEMAVVCFSEPGASEQRCKEIAMKVVGSGEAWISTTVIGGRRTVLRACITNRETQPADVEALVAALDNARGN